MAACKVLKLDDLIIVGVVTSNTDVAQLVETFAEAKCCTKGNSPIAVLFSGGLDSMILAALLDRCVDPKFEIDLLNVSFDGEFSPDRIYATAGIKELRKISPLRNGIW